jgi:MFS family permease
MCGTQDQQQLTVFGLPILSAILFYAMLSMAMCFFLVQTCCWVKARFSGGGTVQEQSENDFEEEDFDEIEEVAPISAGVWAILLTQTLDAFVNTIVTPTMPYYAMNCLGATALDLASFTSAGSFGGMIASPVFGFISDRVGRKKVLLAALAFQGCCNFYQSTCTSVIQLVIARFLVGIAMGSGPVEMAYIIDYIEGDEQLNKVLAVQKVITSSGALLGPCVGVLFSSDQFPLLCYMLVAANAINFTLGSLLWHDKQEEEPDDVDPAEELDTVPGAPTYKSPEDSKAKSIFNASTLTLLAISLVQTLSFQESDSNSAIYYKAYFNFTVSDQCNYSFVQQASTLLLTPVAMLLLRWLGCEIACVLGAIISGVFILNMWFFSGQAWVPYVHAVTVLGLLSTMMGFGYIGILQSKLSSQMQGLFFGVSNSMLSVGGMLAPLAGGYIYNIGKSDDEGHSRMPWRVVPYFITSFGYILVTLLYLSLSFRKDKEMRVEDEDDPLTEPMLGSTKIVGMKPSMSAMSLAGMAGGSGNNVAVKLMNADLEVISAYKRMNRRERANSGGCGKGANTMPVAATAAGNLQNLVRRRPSRTTLNNNPRSWNDLGTHFTRRNSLSGRRGSRLGLSSQPDLIGLGQTGSLPTSSTPVRPKRSFSFSKPP